MRLSVGILLVMLAAFSTTSGQASDSLLRCQALDWAGLANDGRLNPQEGLGVKAFWGDFVVDLLTGVIRYGEVVASDRGVVQAGDGANDTVIAVGSGATVFKSPIVRVRQWDGMSETTFIVVDGGGVVTGTCRAVE